MAAKRYSSVEKQKSLDRYMLNMLNGVVKEQEVESKISQLNSTFNSKIDSNSKRHHQSSQVLARQKNSNLSMVSNSSSNRHHFNLK